MNDLFSNPKFAGYARALGEARAGRSGVAGLVQGRNAAQAMQDAQRARELAAAEERRRQRQREALEQLLRDNNLPADQRMAAIAGMTNAEQGLLTVGQMQSAAAERQRQQDAMARVGGVYGSLLDGKDDPLAMEIKGLLEDPETMQQGVSLLNASGLLDEEEVDPVEPPQISDKMYDLFTTESIARFQVTQDPAVLKRYTEPEETDEGPSREAQDAQRMLSRLQSLASNPRGLAGLYGGFAGIQGMVPDVSDATRAARADLENIISTLQLVEAGKMKGQGTITENERKLIREAATTLSNNRLPEATALQELDRIRDEVVPIIVREFGVEGLSGGIPQFSGGLLDDGPAAGNPRSQPARRGTRSDNGLTPEQRAVLQRYGVSG